jgi:hypothetical protein
MPFPMLEELSLTVTARIRVAAPIRAATVRERLTL